MTKRPHDGNEKPNLKDLMEMGTVYAAKAQHVRFLINFRNGDPDGLGGHALVDALIIPKAEEVDKLGTEFIEALQEFLCVGEEGIGMKRIELIADDLRPRDQQMNNKLRGINPQSYTIDDFPDLKDDKDAEAKVAFYNRLDNALMNEEERIAGNFEYHGN